jgi:hypothetical protein
MAFSKGKTSGKGKGGGKSKGSDYDDENKGVLFTNDKGDNENRPDYTGKVTIKPEDYEARADGLIEIRLAAWLHESANVGQYLSLSASAPKPKE